MENWGLREVLLRLFELSYGDYKGSSFMSVLGELFGREKKEFLDFKW